MRLKFLRRRQKKSEEVAEDQGPCRWLQALETHSVSEMQPKFQVGDVIGLNTSQSVVEGFQTLIKHGFQSLPVRNHALGRYAGFLNVYQLARSAVHYEEQQHKSGNSHPNIDVLEQWQRDNSGDITLDYLAHQNAFHSLPAKANLAQAAAVLGTGVHRVPVVDEEGRVVNLISQLALIRIMSTLLEDMQDIVQETVTTLNLGVSQPGIKTVSTKDDALSAFQLMAKHKFGSIPILDDSGVIIGKTSGHDLECWLKNPTCLKVPIQEFLNSIRSSPGYRKRVAAASQFALLADDSMTLEQAILQLAATKRHHIFIVDKNRKLQRIVSAGDIVRYITDKDEWKRFEWMSSLGDVDSSEPPPEIQHV